MFGIVIANYNGEKLLNICLESIKNQTYNNFSIYIVDNGSTDESINIINSYKDKFTIKTILNKSNLGFAKANNQGIKLAIDKGCKYIITLNNDIELEKDALENARNFIDKNNNLHVFQMLMLNYYNRKSIDCVGISIDDKLIAIPNGINKNIECFNDNIYIDGACAGAAIYSSEALEKVKLRDSEYFDSSYFAYYEDVDLALRLNKENFTACLIKDAIACHMHSATSNKSTGFKQYYSARNLFLYTKRNQTEELYKKNFKNYLIIILKRIVFAFINFDFKVILSQIKGTVDGIIENKKVKSRL